MNEPSWEDLETRIAYQDRSIEKLEAALADHERRLDELERGFDAMIGRLRDESSEEPD